MIISKKLLAGKDYRSYYSINVLYYLCTLTNFHIEVNTFKAQAIINAVFKCILSLYNENI